MQSIVILAGNIGQNPEARTTKGASTQITNFSLATSRSRLSEGRVMRDDNGYRVMDTEWHRITCFNGLGKTVTEYCEKGMKVLAHGRIHYSKWIDSMGIDRYGCEIIAETSLAVRNQPRAKTPSWSTATTRSRSEGGFTRRVSPSGPTGQPAGFGERRSRLGPVWRWRTY